MTLPPLGLWIDCAKRRVLTPQYWDDLHNLGVTTAAVMIDRSTAAWDPFYSEDEIRALGLLAIERDMELILTTWPVPRRVELQAMLGDMKWLLLTGASGWEIDVEGLWRTSEVRVFRPRSLLAAERFLVEGMRKIADMYDVRLELTAHTGRPQQRLASRMDRYLLQVYSKAHRDGDLVPWAGPLGPGRLQRKYLARAAKVEGPKLAAGLAAWDQQWPGHTITEALEKALDAALEFDPCEVRYWSSKWVRRRDRSAAEVRDFLRWNWGR